MLKYKSKYTKCNFHSNVLMLFMELCECFLTFYPFLLKSGFKVADPYFLF
ncbi:unnamed protein product [Tenebrio molitor]|nr:unnamed protein product [Tenebrio molitor]